ncbi:low-affinity Fe(2+) transport protein [Ascosphaera pollenicola]|nr:low-affinity Fe(2+) transport protein [Ascosphaera pollenicola]
MAPPEPQINFFKGYPNPSLHPTVPLNHAALMVLSDPKISVPALSYGPDEGHGPLREAIAEWLTKTYTSPAKPITADRIVITGGASQNLAATLNVFTDPVLTKAIWMVSPTYYLACRIFDDAGFSGKLKAVPEDGEGIDLAALEGGMAAVDTNFEGRIPSEGTKRARPWRKIFSQVIYCVPTFANPSGKIMSASHREGLIRLARKHNALIVTDDVYDMLCWYPAASEGSNVPKCVPRLVDIDRDLDGGPPDEFGNTISNGSFSKIVAPGLRVGYCEAMPRLAWGVSQAGSSRSGGAPSQWTSTLVCDLLTTGWLEKHIAETLRPTYRRRSDKLMHAIRKYLLPIGVQFTIPWQRDNNPAPSQLMGGYFIWLRLPSEIPISARALAELAEKEENLLFTPGESCEVDEPGEDFFQPHLDKYIRLCFAYENEELFDDGVQRLARVIRKASPAIRTGGDGSADS